MTVLTSPMTLNNIALAAGTLLVYNGATIPDQILALNPLTGSVLAHCPFPPIPMTVSVWLTTCSATSLFLLRSNQVLELNPTTGAVINGFATPVGRLRWIVSMASSA